VANVPQVQELIEPAVTALGYELWGVQLLSQGRHSTLRIFIDKPEGINIDDCTAVSHQVSGILDVEDPIKSQYTLEVSSPGIDRPLFKLDQYQRYVGEDIALRLRTPVAGRRKFSGLLKAVEADNIIVRIEEENEEYVLPFESIDKANIVSKDFS
jgi:ribosome maturation factor RimP